MVMASRSGVPLGIHLDSASPAEVRLLETTLADVKVPRPGRGRPRSKPKRIVADRGYDADWLRDTLTARGIELICPHRRGRKRPAKQDGRSLRRYKRRWIVKRTFAWLSNFRRLVVRYERKITMFRAFAHVACVLIALRQF